MNRYNSLCKKGLKEIRSSTTGSPLLDLGIEFQKGGFTLVKGEPYVGITSFCIQIAEHFSKESIVVYVDINNNLNNKRTENVKSENLIFVQATNYQPILHLAFELQEKFNEGIVYIFDQGSLLREGGSLEQTAVTLRVINPLNTVIAAERIKYRATELWGERIYLTFGDKFYYNRELYGHEIHIKGSKGKTKHFVSHFTGRFSPAFEKAYLETLEGKQKTETFEYNHLVKKGFWNFLASALEKGF